MLVVLGCLLVVASLPPVQSALVRSFTGDLENVEVELGSIWAVPWALSLQDLSLSGQGYTMTVDSVSVDLAFWSSLAHWRLEVEHAVLRDVAIRLDRSLQIGAGSAADANSTAAADDAAGVGTLELPSPEELAPGLRERLVLPDWLAVRSAEAQGSLTVLTANAGTIASAWQATAADWLPERDATATLTGSATAERDGESLAALTLSTEASFTIAPGSSVESFAIAASLDTADGQQGLAVRTTGNLLSADERYGLTIDTRAGQRLVDIDAAVTADDTLATEWSIDVPSGVVAAFARGRSVADLTARSDGRLNVQRRSGSMTLEADGTVLGSGWQAFDPRLQGLGPMTFDFSVDADAVPGRVSARAARIELITAARGGLLLVEVLQPLGFTTDSWRAEPERWGEPAVRVELNELPLRWLRPFDPSGQLVDGLVSLSLEMIRDGERETRLVAAEPITVTDIELAPVAGNAVPEFDITLVPEATLQDGMLDADIEELVISAATGLSVSFTGSGSTSRADWPVVAFSGELAARVPALQRLITPLQQLRASTELSFDFESLVLSVAGASASADGGEGRRLLLADFSGQTPLEINLPTFQPDWAAFEPRTFSLTIDRLPIDWLTPYLPELGFANGELTGILQARAAIGSGLELTTDAPITIDNLTPTFRGRPFAQALTASVMPELVLTNEYSLLMLDDFRIDSANGDSLQGQMDIRAEANSRSIAFGVELDGNFPTLANRSGANLGTMRYRHRGAIRPDEQRLDIDTFELEFSDDSDSAFLRFESLQPFYLTAEPFSVGASGGGADILKASVTPLRLEQLIPRIFGMDLEGVLPQGEFYGRAAPNGGLVLAADDPLEFRDVTVHWEEARLLDRVTMRVGYEIEYSSDGIEARSVDISASGPAAEPMFELTSVVRAPLSIDTTWSFASLRLSANLPALADQPILADLPRFRSGALLSELRLTNDAETRIDFSASMRDAETERLGRLPDVDLGIDLAGVRNQSATLSMPIALQSTRFGASDLLLQGTLEREQSGLRHIDAVVSGERLVASDLSRLLALFALPDDDASPEDPDRSAAGRIDRTALAKLRTERHEKPLWTDQIAGSAGIDIGRVLLPSFDLQGLSGRVDVSPTHAELVDLEASLLDARIGAEAYLDFDAASASPYSLEFSAAIDNLDLGQLFRAVHPDTIPTAEGRFDFSTELNGSGRNPLDLALSTFGEITLTGGDGVFRGLASFAGTGSTASRVIGVLTFSRELRALGRLLDGLGEIHFDEAEIALTRTVRNRIELDRLSLRAPQLWLQGSGDIELSPELPVLLSPLDMTAEISARGDVAILFDGMELLQGDRDDEQYRPLTRPIPITGTAAEPDASAFWALLDEGAENARGAFGVGLRALDRRLQASAEN